MLSKFAHIEFAHPIMFWLFLLIPLLIVWYWRNQKRLNPAIILSTAFVLKDVKPSLKQRLRHLTFVFRMLVFVFLILTLARPQSSTSRQDVSIEGIDIVLAMDISGSMLAEDFRPNRLEASKDVAMNFIDARVNDRIGLVVFSGESFTQCPITTDHSVLKNLFSGIKSGMIEDGTALGDGLATAVSRLKNSTAVSKVIILLTDGVNNAGFVDPQSAAEIAQLYGIRVYTIGVGTRGMAPYPFETPFGKQYQNIEVQIDEPLLKKISASTDGKYFRATNKKSLEQIYQEIDKMEKSKIDVSEFKRRHEEFMPFLMLALALLLAEFLLKHFYFRTTP